MESPCRGAVSPVHEPTSVRCNAFRNPALGRHDGLARTRPTARRHPVHVIEIDRSFIADAPQNAEATAIIAAIVAMARSLLKETVAEGVETAEQLTLPERLGCTTAQGFYFARPVPAEDLLRFVRERSESGRAGERVLEFPSGPVSLGHSLGKTRSR